MNWLKSGPDLKMPDLKVPDFLVDLYWDLRDRHLLPLVVLAIVAIVAVPFVLSGGSEEEESAGPASVSAAPSPRAAGAKLTVVESKPGLREYKKRLRGDSPTDPFVQRYTASPGGKEASTSSTSTSSSTSTTTSKSTSGGGGGQGSGGGPGGSGSAGSTTTTETGGHATPSPSPSPAPSPGGSPPPPGQHLTLYSFAIDVKITVTSGGEGDKQKSAPTVRNRVLPPAALPGDNNQVVTYMGISPKTEHPLFLVSDEVTSVFGEGKCLSGDQVCQLIEVEPNFPETFVYGLAAKRYKIDVLKVEPVTAGKY